MNRTQTNDLPDEYLQEYLALTGETLYTKSRKGSMDGQWDEEEENSSPRPDQDAQVPQEASKY